ncbi:glutathione S-transferase family protein [Marivibrio halodurans]|uniref:Glutathione S-transferase family protein n=1 Tax=Marivibrio halodurans TaxID=2039722 RepID=A0A8J7V174_9PROT|nr:glutathione S-transferase family protein [Marivibrio halodurans]MBP5855821.1 glutathione S-transferase family protein [Marivibrio halodurans]
MAFTLYGAPGSGNCHKVARMLKLCDLPATYRFINLMEGAQHDPAFWEISPLGEIPVLVDGGKALYQSPLILKHLAEKTGRFGPDTADERYRMDSWLIFDQQRIFPSIAVKRFTMRFTPQFGNPEVYAFLDMNARRALRELDRALSVSDYLVGASPTIADIACSAYPLMAGEAEIDIPAEWPAVAAWLDRLTALPGWVAPYDLMGREDGPL